MGIITLSGRTFLLQIIALIANFLLTIFLSPREYGVFFIVSAAVGFLVYFSDIGLAAALIQKKDKLTKEDLSTTFTIQQLLVLSLVLLSFFFSSKIAVFYNLSLAGLWLLRSLVFSFFLSSLKTIPSILLERKLKFDKLIIPQLIESIVFYITAVFLAWRGKGVASFTWAVFFRGIVGLIAIYLLMPWKPSFRVNKKSARKLLSFGIPFQVNSFLALLKDNLLTALLGKMLLFSEVGFIGWAQKWAFFPLRFFMDSVNKVTFPAYSRLQEKRKTLVKAVEKSIYGISVTVFPTLTGLFLLAPFFVKFFPKYQKWQPALISLVFFSINGMFSSISTTLTNVLNALGQIKITLKLMILWTILTWVFTLIFLKLWGYNGVAIASALVSATVFLPIIFVKNILPVKIISNIKSSFLATILMAIFLYFLSSVFITSLLRLVIIVILGGGFYFVCLYFLDKKRLQEEAKFILGNLK